MTSLTVDRDVDATEIDHEAERRRRRRFWIILGLIMALGLAIRVAFILIRQSNAPFSTGDAYWYHFQAKLVADGKGFLNPFQYYRNGVVTQGGDHPPGLVAILTVFDKLGIGSVQAQRVGLSVMGIGSVALIGLTGRRMAGPTVGLIAAFLAAVYPNIWINDGMLMVETAFIFGIALSFLFSYRYLQERGRWNVVGISVGLTLAALTRPEATILFPFLLTPMLLCRRDLSWRERFTQLAIAALIPIACYGPWLGYNMTRFEKPVLISTGAGQSLVVANCDLTYDGAFLGYWDVNCLLPPQLPTQKEKDLSVLDQQLQKRAKDYMKDHIGEVPKVVAARIGRMWGLYRPQQSIVLDGYIEGRAGGQPGTGFGLVREALWAYFAIAALAIPGAIILRRRRVPIYPLMSQIALATFVASITFGITRYRAGAEVAIVLFAAVTLGAIGSWMFSRGDRPGDDQEIEPLPEPDPGSTERGSADGDRVSVPV